MEDRNIKPLGFNFFMGTVLFLKDRYIKAKKYFSQAIERGRDAARPYLLDIHVREGNYVAAFELLQDMALYWGNKYTDIASIKASILLSYMLERGLGVLKDFIEFYKWADRAKRIYIVSKNNIIPRQVDPQTGRYMLFDIADFNSPTETATVVRVTGLYF